MKNELIFLLFFLVPLHSKEDENQNFEAFGNTGEGWEAGEIHIFEDDAKRSSRSRRTISNNLNKITITSGKRRLDIQLEPISSPLSSIHFRDGEFLTSVPLGEADEQFNCHWRGQVKGGGTATFSTCQEHNSFSGAVLTDEGLWLIRPMEYNEQEYAEDRSHSKSRSRRDRNGVHHISHLILTPASTAAQFSRGRAVSDVARVPLQELEAAARLAAQDAENREALRDSDEDDEEIVLILTQDEDGDEDDDEVPVADYFSYFPPWLRWDYYNHGNENFLSFPFFGGSRPRLPLLNHPTILAERKIRELESKKKWVEMALFTDDSMYKKMEKKFSNDTIAKLKDYATTMVNMMDLLYGHKSLGVDIGFRLVHLEVMKKPPTALDSNGGKAKAYLSSFCDYAGNQNVNSGLWDHALLLTGLDLHEQGLKSTAGLAWSGTMCYRYYSCSVAEGNSLGAAFIITHEIGHSLGMEHDGVGVSEVCDRDKFIMSPTTGAGKVSWSNCSGKNLQDFIDYGTSELRSKKYSSATLSKPTCLSEIVTKGKSSTKASKLPGETYDAYFQCSLGLGSTFKPYFQRNKSPFNNICNILYCGNGTHAVSTHPALDGTKCDKDKYCKAGSCVKRPKK